MKKPKHISHYLVLSDLLDNIDVRQYSDTIVYLTSRIENIKVDLVKSGIDFIDDVSRESRYSYYKPYILQPTMDNLNKAKELLKSYATDDVLCFLEQKPSIDAVNHYEAQGSN
ncbi:MAG: hypothetical protein ACI9TV_000341 [Sulfurimonas sp.]|jgi:hypothetical protein|uniref:hypothetical protein n=1 Tax=Sulfurimonas sp. TaxID=2022749 RepID=UPI0039E3F76F